MRSRVFFAVIAIFWLTMNTLLWRAEFGSGSGGGSPASLAGVWQKILTAPDNSSLDILLNGKKAGFVRWLPNVGHEAATGQVNSEDYVPEGQVKRLTGYTLDIDGNIQWPGLPARIFFSLGLRLSTNGDWRVLASRIRLSPTVLEIRASAPDQNVRLLVDDGKTRTERVFSFNDLQNPQALVESLAGPFAMGLLGGLVPGPSPAGTTGGLSFDIPWTATSDFLPLRHSRVRAYRLHARLLDRYDIDVYVSQVGEILRVDLPGGTRLATDALPGI